jgi:EAL domain-containing protein (putative c-di-GMP-specific phosphodiesterase class I)
MTDSNEVRSWSGPIKNLAEGERRSLVASMSAGQRPGISLSEALRFRWLEIWYQPKIDLKRKFLAGAEALARIRHPELGVLLPASFLPGADEAGLAELAQHALLATLFDWAVFEEAGFNLQLSVNVPVSALFKLPIPRLIAQYRPNAQRWPGLVLEISEDQIARHMEFADKVAMRLRVSGTSISIDDFGAGYSSLSSLRHLPFTEIKIHESFVAGCAVDPTNAAICQTAVDLAHRFGGVAAAEGVENAADLQALMAMGCDFGQGILIAPPMPKARFLELLRQRSGKRHSPAHQAVIKAPSKPIGRVA